MFSLNFVVDPFKPETSDISALQNWMMSQ